MECKYEQQLRDGKRLWSCLSISTGGNTHWYQRECLTGNCKVKSWLWEFWNIFEQEIETLMICMSTMHNRKEKMDNHEYQVWWQLRTTGPQSTGMVCGKQYGLHLITRVNYTGKWSEKNTRASDYPEKKKKGKCSHESNSACGKQTEHKMEKNIKCRSFVMTGITPRGLDTLHTQTVKSSGHNLFRKYSKHKRRCWAGPLLWECCHLFQGCMWLHVLTYITQDGA